MLTLKILNICVVVFLSISFIGCESKKKETTEDKVVENIIVDTYVAAKGIYPIWIDFSGKTEAYKDVEVLSRVSGELKNTYFQAGDSVKKGQVIFKIDDLQYKAVLDQKKATLQKDEANLVLAQATFNRYEPLVKKDLVSKEKLDELKANVKQLQAVVAADTAVVKQAKLDVTYTKVKASIDGHIGKETISIGNFVSANTTSLTRIVKSDTLYVNFSPSAETVSIIKKYRSEIKPIVVVRLDNNTDIELEGNIDFIDNATNTTTGTVNMRAILQNKDNVILPGTFVEIKLLLTDKLPLLAVHPSNIGQNQLGAFVYVVNVENKIQTKQVKVRYSNNDLAIIKSGLSEGDKVVVSNITKLRDNLLVDVRPVSNPIKK